MPTCRIRHLLAAMLAGVVALSVTPSAVHAELPPDFFPPNPGPVAVQPGEMGCFPLPGLFFGPEREIKVVFDGPDALMPIAEPPASNGELDSVMCVGLKDGTFVGVAVFHVTLSSSRGASFTYDLDLYIGVPLPAAGAPVRPYLAVGAALLLGGLVLVALVRRRVAIA